MPFSGRFCLTDTQAWQRFAAVSHLAELGSGPLKPRHASVTVNDPLRDPWAMALATPHTGHFANGHWGRLLELRAAVKVPDNLAEFHGESVGDVIGLS